MMDATWTYVSVDFFDGAESAPIDASYYYLLLSILDRIYRGLPR